LQHFINPAKKNIRFYGLCRLPPHFAVDH